MALTPQASEGPKKPIAVSAGADNIPVLDVLEVEFTSFAEQVTLIDHDLFKAIPGHEFLKLNFTNPEKSPGFAAMVAKFNEVSD